MLRWNSISLTQLATAKCCLSSVFVVAYPAPHVGLLPAAGCPCNLAQEDGVCEEPGLLRQLDLLRSARLMRLAFICQDMADGLMAVNDITGGWERWPIGEEGGGP